MPPHGKEVHVTELEVAVIRLFAEFGQFSDREIAHDLKLLADKLEGNYAQGTSRD